MKRFVGIGALLAGLLFHLTVATAQNDQELAFGPYVVNYNTFPSTFLDQQIARVAGVNRAENLGVITLAVRKRVPGGRDEPVKADISATATNLIGQISRVKLGEIVEKEAVYYIGNFTTTSDGTITFKVIVQPAGEKQKQEFSFSRRF